MIHCLILAKLLSSPVVDALVPSILESPPQKNHYVFYSNIYWKWQNKNFFDWNKYLSKNEKKLIEKLLGLGNHWLTPSSLPRKETFTLGFGYLPKEKINFYTLEIYVPDQDFDLSPLNIYDSNHLKNIKFLKWSTFKNTFCLIGLLNQNDYRHQCYDRHHKKLISIYDERVENFFKDRFILGGPILEKRSFFSLDKEKKGDFYYTNSAKHVLLPESLQKIVVNHGIETRLPLDKVQLWNDGSLVIFYP